MLRSVNTTTQLPTASHEMARYVVRALLVVTALACIASIAAVVLIPREPSALVGGLVAAGAFASLIGAAALIAWMGRLRVAVAIALASMVLGVTVFAWRSSLGVHSVTLSVIGLVIVVAGVLLGMRAALAFSAVCVAVSVGLYFAELQGVLVGINGVQPPPVMGRLVNWLMLIGVALALGWLLAGVVQSSLDEVRVKEQRFSALVRHAPLAFIIHRGEWIALANDAAARVFGSDDAQAMTGAALSAFDGVGPAGSISALAAEGEHLALGASLPLRELRLRRVDGGDLVVEAQSMRIEQPDGPATLTVLLDLTEHRRARSQLARSDALVSRLFDASLDAVIVATWPEGRIELVNKGFTEMSGIPAAHAQGRTTVDIGIWAIEAERDAFIALLGRDGQARGFAAHLHCAGGDIRSVVLSSSLFHLDGAAFSVSTLRDVTEVQRERMEYGAILENASVGIAFTRNRRFVLANARFEEMFGWARGEIVGQQGRVAWPSDADYEELGRRLGPALARGEAVDVDQQAARKDGSLFWCHVRARAVDSANPVHGGTIWIAEDVTARRAAEAALAAAKDAAEEANRAKSLFLANMSHEIRTPLNGVLGLARLALEPGVEPARMRDYLSRIHESGQSLAAIISDILDLSKIEAGKLTIERTAFDLRAMLAALQAGYRDMARGKDLSFEVAIAPDVPPYVSGDPTRVRQILVNFISNAIKFTERGGVAIDVRRVGADRVRFAVSDSGIGIDPATCERLFAPFTQADASTTRRYGGSGLGLSICRQLAELMGGAVGVDSAPGMGSTFWAEVPLEAAAAPAMSVSAEIPVGERTGLRGMRVLVVEDNPVNMLLAETLLVNWGVEVVQAHDGQQAIDAIEHDAAFDVVLMDVHMPVLSGHEATRVLRRRYDKDMLPIVALTAAALSSEQAQSIEAGMNDFITKPFEAERLYQVLLPYANRRRLAA